MSIKNIFINMKGIIKIKLRESLLGEGSINIPKEIVNKFGVLYDLIKDNYDEALKKSPENHLEPFIAYKDFFKLKDNGGKPLNISIGLYNKKDNADGRINTRDDILLINMEYFKNMSVSYFEELVYHELVHGMDPLVRDIKVFNKYYDKHGAEPSGSKLVSSKNDKKSEYEKSYEKYKNSQHEYTAEISKLVPIIKKRVGNDENKLKWMFWVISNVKLFNKVDELYINTHNQLENMQKIKLFADDKDYWIFLQKLFNIIKTWVNNPKINKKFLNDLYKEIKK